MVPRDSTEKRLKDGRCLAYKEYGVPTDVAKYKIIYVHGFKSSRHNAYVATTLSPEIIEELGVYVVSFDRPELADQLELGSKFYVIGYSLGGQAIWRCLKYIPQRLAGVAVLAPAVTYWWSNFPANVSNEAFNQKSMKDRWAIRVAHYAPWLVYWWNTRKLFPATSVLAGRSDALSSQASQQITQGVFESLHHDLIVLHGAWEFDPLDLANPFPNNEGSVHLWHGDRDKIVPIIINRYIAEQRPWIRYHEIPGAGHFFPLGDGMSYAIIKALLIGEK
ncbi:Detected protein of confused Function [Hibiscus syriacus]|uniref:Detected protein of confused Function n=1 Tax=Hibiscus syriacus TaxID=106335 RepID=A0A6A2XT59_HIBSY|nr:Detected protein of confused Function [Hibiscus syriacus]